MCNIHTKTDLKTITVYKAVVKIDEDYYSCFAGTKIELGKVKRQTFKRVHKALYYSNLFSIGGLFYNKHMVGKCSGFQLPDDAKILKIFTDGKTILKIVLGGTIWLGDASNIYFEIPDDHIVYAGSEIISFEEFK